MPFTSHENFVSILETIEAQGVLRNAVHKSASVGS